jgi:D-glycero-D-manno-heptose 1,7-bisphosphate phosphatase
VSAARSPLPDAVIGADGIWEQVLRPPPPSPASPRAALFCDRDGTIIEDVGYLQRPEDVRLIDGAARLIGLANRRGVAVVVVTNQSGIGRGILGWQEFATVQARLVALLAADGAGIDAVFACPHHPDGRPPYDHPDHPDRKPNPGLIHRAAVRLGLALPSSWLIGDRASDILAARRAGLAGALLVATGAGSAADERGRARGQRAAGGFRVALAPSIAAAAAVIGLLGGGGADRVL